MKEPTLLFEQNSVITSTIYRILHILHIRISRIIRTLWIAHNVVVWKVGYTLARWRRMRFTISYHNVSVTVVRHNRRNGVIRRLNMVTRPLRRTRRTDTARFWGCPYRFEYFFKIRPTTKQREIRTWKFYYEEEILNSTGSRLDGITSAVR